MIGDLIHDLVVGALAGAAVLCGLYSLVPYDLKTELAEQRWGAIGGAAGFTFALVAVLA